MATRKVASPASRPANLTVAQMQEALPKLERRLRELESFDAFLAGDDVGNQAEALQQKYEDTLVDVFGNESVEYRRYHVDQFYESSGLSFNFFEQQGPSRRETADAYQKGVAKGVAVLRTIIELFKEKIGDSAGPVALPSRVLETLDLHPQIADAAVDLFKGGHYANAVEDACKALDLLVKLKSKKSDPSGTELMQLVFSQRNPILKFNDQLNESEKSEQQGMMFLYAGAMLAFRNPRAHGLMDDDSSLALEIIGFVNFLAKALERTRRV